MSRLTARRHLVLVLGVLFLLAITGCGGSDDDEPALTKRQFIAQGDAICAKVDVKQQEGLQKFVEAGKGDIADKRVQEQVIREVGIVPIQEAAEELATLGAPDGDEEQVDEIIASIEEGVESGEADPSRLTSKQRSPFVKSDKLAREYGFKACADIY